MSTLKPNQSLIGASSGATYQVLRLLGEGGQGEAHEVRMAGIPATSQRYAVKWYHGATLRLDHKVRERLKVAIDRGPPSARFIWPMELVTLANGSGLGYVMRLKSERFQKMEALFGHDSLLDASLSFRARATMCCLLADAMFALHAKGLAYQDINAGGVFLDPETGDIEVCDNDNVDVDGAPSIMAGQREYQAPEIVLRRAGPSRATDLHSLAVLLFRVLHKGHPLVGRRESLHENFDDAATRSLYGTHPVFVFDPTDDSNRPLPDRHGPIQAHWDIYPPALRELFVKAFTTGLHDPEHGRVQESEWRRAMSKLRDSVMTCHSCGAENFYDSKRISAKISSFPCWGCQTPQLSAPPRIGLRRIGARPGEPPLHVVILEPGVQLFGHHTQVKEYDFTSAHAEVARNPDGPALLHNLSRQSWTVAHEGVTYNVPPGESVPVVPGARIRFERTEGEIKGASREGSLV